MDADVVAMRHTFIQWNYGLLPLERVAATNDLGALRLVCLPPSKYLIVALWGSRASASRDNVESRASRPTYTRDRPTSPRRNQSVSTDADAGPLNMT
jgi:hypothetical protein